MSEENTESAFPFVVGAPTEWHYERGMTLRDYFAGQALAGICATEQSEKYGCHKDDHWNASKRAYGYADAMIEARKGGQYE